MAGGRERVKRNGMECVGKKRGGEKFSGTLSLSHTPPPSALLAPSFCLAKPHAKPTPPVNPCDINSVSTWRHAAKGER